MYVVYSLCYLHTYHNHIIPASIIVLR